MTRLSIVLSAALIVQSAVGIGTIVDVLRMRDLVRDTLELAEGWKKIALQADADGCEAIHAGFKGKGRAAP